MIAANQGQYSIGKMCQVMGVSRAGYYAWRRRPRSVRQRADDALSVEIRAVHAQSKGRYGVRKVRHALVRLGKSASHKRVARLMRQSGLKSRRIRRFKQTTHSTHSTHGLPVAPNVLNREFTTNQPNTKWVSDITFVPTREGWLYLAVVIDLFSRRVVGWAIGERVTRALVIAAFDMAAQSRDIAAGLLFHSDQGSQLAARRGCSPATISLT
jgi:putative transposase